MIIERRYYAMALMALAVIGLTACDGDEVSSSANVIAIEEGVKSSLMAAGEESTLTCSKSVESVYATQSWLQVSASGRKVTYSAGPNLSRESRHAALVIKASATDSTLVNISQEGLILTYSGDRKVVPSNEATTVRVGFASNELALAHIVSQPDWIESAIEGDSIRMALSANESGSARAGYVVFGAGQAQDSVKVIQYDTKNLVSSNWLLMGYGVVDGSLQGGTASLSFWGKTAYLTLKEPMGTGSSNWKFTLTFDPNTLTFSFPNGQFIGKDTEGNDVAVILISSGYQMTLGTEPVGRFTLDLMEDGLLYGYLGGTFPAEVGDLSVIGMLYVPFKGKELSESLRLEELGGFAPCWTALPSLH